MVEKYLISLLFEHDYVVIPQFGGFMSHYVSVKIDKSTGHLLPPSKEIAFNKMLSQNDWVLVHAVMIGEEIPQDLALSFVENYAQSIVNSLNIKGFYQIPELGILKKQADNTILFESQNKINFLSHSFGLKEINCHPIKNISTAQLNKSYNHLKTRKLRVGSVLAASLLLALITSVFLYVNKEDKALSSFNPFYILSSHHTLIDSSDLPNPERFYKAHYDSKKSKSTTKLDSFEISSNQILDTLNKDLVTKSEIKTIQTKTEDTFFENKEGYYIILAGFKDSLSLVNEAQKYKSKGILNKFYGLLPISENEPFRLAGAYFKNYEDAKLHLPELKNMYGETIWVLKR